MTALALGDRPTNASGADELARIVADIPEYAGELFAPHRYKVLYGGRGAARSWSVARALLIIAASKPTRIGCFREVQNSIAASVHQLLKDQIDLLELPGYLVTDREIRHENGSIFRFAGLRSNATKIKSFEGIDIAWVEEAEGVSKTSWDILIPTIRKAGSEIWVNFNPDQEDDPTYQRFVVKPPPNAWVLKVSADDNPWFPDELAEERAYLYSVDPDAAAHVWGGECRQSSAAQILHGKWIVEDFQSAPSWDGPYYGADFGFAQDPNILVKLWIAPGTRPKSTGRLMVEYEAYKIGQDTDYIAEAWTRQVPGCVEHRIRADSARPETISYLRRHGLPNIVGVDKWKGSVEDGIAHLRQYEQIVIHPRCTHAIQEARHYRYKVDERTGDILPVVVDADNHIWDCARYALAPLIRKRGGTTDPSQWDTFTK